jgi:phosphoribosylformylglycinamidine synthase
VLRIGVTDNSGELEIQDLATFNIDDLRNAFKGTIPALFG